MVLQAIGELLPFSVGVALSPIPIVAVVLMLGTPRARTNGPAFALGWLIGLTAAAVIVLLVTGGASDPDSGAAQSVDWAQLAIGVLFLAMAAKQWKSRPKPGEEPAMPKWMAKIDEIRPLSALGLGILLSGINPKNLALAAAAGAAIARAGLDAGGDAVGIAVFVGLGSVTVVGAVLFYLVAPRLAVGPLASIEEFMSTHNAVIMMVILLLLGAKLIGSALGGLGSL